ncbi:MAG TPA: hypothetical protein VFX16_13850 [Pseudonocardiaceae bacterium]|nr:hypothetical protein [Pseudonocardiaceae bacterium]
MSEATASQAEETSPIPLGNSPEPPEPPRRGRQFGPFRRRTVLAVVIILAAGVLVSWIASSTRQSTDGRAVPGSGLVVDTTGPSAAAVPPAIPAQLVAAVDHNAVELTWKAATGSHPVTQYVVFRDGKKVATVQGATTWRDTTAAAGHKYAYQVRAMDSTGAGSPLSPKVSVSVPNKAAGGTATGNAGAKPANLPPMPASWPSATSTGASGSLTTVNGDVVLNTAGQVYSNKRVKGTLAITACNVTLRNVEVDSGEPYTGDDTPDLFAIWLQESATCGVTLDHVSTITDSAPNVYVTTSVRVARGGPVTITNSKLIGAQLGILGVTSGTVRGNYIELGKNMRGDHNDAIQGDGSSNLTIDHNTLLNPNDQTSALALYTEFGNNKNITVSNNLMAGGGYTCYCGDGATDNDGNPARAVNVSIVNNVFWRRYFGDAGSFGPARAYNPAGGGQWAGNVYMAADGTLTTQQVSQPALDGH